MARRRIKIHDEATNTDVEVEEDIIEEGEPAPVEEVAAVEAAPAPEPAPEPEAPAPEPVLSEQTLREMAAGAETLKRYAR